MSIFSKIAKLPIGRYLGRVAMVAAPTIATAVGGPAAGALAVTALGTGFGLKKAGQKIEDKTGYPVHKVAAPIGAVGLPAALGALLAPFIPVEWIPLICEFTRQMCEEPGIIEMGAAAGAGAGVLALLAHNVGKALEKTIDGRK